MTTNKAIDRVLLAVILALLLLATVPLFAQDSPAALDQRWRDAGTTPYQPSILFHPSNNTAEVYNGNAVAPHPGMWHCATSGNFRYCPCYPLPYATWTDPETNNLGLFRYDFSPMKQPQACPGGIGVPPCSYANNGGPNHSLTWLDPGAVERPIQRQPVTNGFYPGPAGLCSVWLANGNTGVCPNTNYVGAIKANSVWVTAYNYKKPAMDADPGCQGGAVTPTPSKTPTPAVTPTPQPSIYADWVYAAVAQGYLVGCGGNRFCPGDPSVMQQGLLTRAQETVFLLKSVHGPSYVPPKCVAPGAFVDVACAP